MKKNIIFIIAIVLILVLIGYVAASNAMYATTKIQNPIVTMEVENFGKVTIELYPEYAPNTVANFVSLIKEGYYDGLTFHRAVEDFMVQGGDKAGDGTGSTEKTIVGEFIENGFEKNTLRHDRGVIAMARADYSYYGYTTEGYNSAFSQFFIMTKDNTNINGMYAAFGKVIEGMEVIDAIAKVESIQEKDTTTTDKEKTEENKEEVKNPTITKMTVDTFGVDYGTPERIEAFDIYKSLYRTSY